MWEPNGRRSTSGEVGFVKLLISVIVIALAVWIIIATHPENAHQRVNWNYPQTFER